MADRPKNRSTQPTPTPGVSPSQSHRSGPALSHKDTNGADTIFDFSLPDRSAQEVADLQRRADYLLDEMEMGGAARSAWAGDEGYGEPSVRNGHSAEAYNGNGHAQSPVGRFDDPVPAEPQSQVAPETVLPSIKSRPSAATSRSDEEFILAPKPKAPESPLLKPRRHTAISTPVSGIDPGEAQRMEEEITQLYNQINRLQQSRRDITGHALSLLREARTIIISQPERLGRAEYNIRQVHTILQRTRENRRRSTRNGIFLLLYLSLWLALCAGGITALFLYQGDLLTLVGANNSANSGAARHLLPLSWTVLLGGTGGVVGAMVSLVGLMRDGQEFDSQYMVRYVIQPVMGVVLAISVYGLALIFFGLVDMDLTARTLTQWVPPAVALPVGLWQEGVYSMLYRFSRIFRFGRRR